MQLEVAFLPLSIMTTYYPYVSKEGLERVSLVKSFLLCSSTKRLSIQDPLHYPRELILILICSKEGVREGRFNRVVNPFEAQPRSFRFKIRLKNETLVEMH